MDWSSLNIPSNLFKVNLQDPTLSDADTNEEDDIIDSTYGIPDHTLKNDSALNASLNKEEFLMESPKDLVLFGKSFY